MNGAQVLAGNDISQQQLGSNWHIVGTGDFNGDNKTDILWRNDIGTLQVWTMNGLSVLSTTETSRPIGVDWHVVPTHYDLG
jgi:hypothetical protein